MVNIDLIIRNVFFLCALISLLSVKPVSAWSSISITTLCSQSPAECLANIDDEILGAPVKSRRWYQLQQFKIQALFDLQNNTELYELTKYWLSQPDLPIPFQFSVYLYYAKTAVYFGHEDEGKKYIEKAQTKLDMMNTVYPAPMRLVELANIQLYLGDTEQAYQSLLALLAKHEKSSNAHLLLEIYGNLAHLATKNEQLVLALSYWKKAIVSAKEYGNIQQIATVYFNMANLQRGMGKFAVAEHNFLQTIQYAQVAKDLIKITNANLLIADIKVKQGKHQEAKSMLSRVDKSTLSKEHLEIYNQVYSFNVNKQTPGVN